MCPDFQMSIVVKATYIFHCHVNMNQVPQLSLPADSCEPGAGVSGTWSDVIVIVTAGCCRAGTVTSASTSSIMVSFFSFSIN